MKKKFFFLYFTEKNFFLMNVFKIPNTNKTIFKQSNAKFTFDVKPGVGIFDEEKIKTNSPVNSSTCQFNDGGLDPVTYDTLVNYLDYELPRQQQEQLDASPAPTPISIAPSPPVATTPIAPTPKRIQPRPLAPALAPVATPVSRQVLLPKPPVLDPVALASLLSQAAALAASSTQSTPPSVAPSPVVKKIQAKRPREESPVLEDDQNLDEDKRRRNTAASARFRVKKKMREQAMEESVREMSLKSDHLQNRVESLESEIKFLRSLLLEKADKS